MWRKLARLLRERKLDILMVCFAVLVTYWLTGPIVTGVIVVLVLLVLLLAYLSGDTKWN